MICDAELCGGHAGPSRFVVVLHGCHRIDEIGLDCASSKAGQTIRDSPASLVRVDAGPVDIKFRCLVQDGHEEAATLGVMRQHAHAALNVHHLHILLRPHAWHHLVMRLLDSNKDIHLVSG